jgi:hypothetical protein
MAANRNASREGRVMRFRSYLGLVLGVVLALTLAASVAANHIGWNSVTNQDIGWNSEIFTHSPNGPVTYQLKYCHRADNATSVTFDLMHHWFGLPSTGTQTVTYPCQNNGTVWTYTWTNRASADYSVEYNGVRYCSGHSCADSHASFQYYIAY